MATLKQLIYNIIYSLDKIEIETDTKSKIKTDTESKIETDTESKLNIHCRLGINDNYYTKFWIYLFMLQFLIWQLIKKKLV